MTTLWSEFIKYGNPGGGWNPVGQESKQFLDFNLKPRMESRSEHYEEKNGILEIYILSRPSIRFGSFF